MHRRTVRMLSENDSELFAKTKLTRSKYESLIRKPERNRVFRMGSSGGLTIKMKKASGGWTPSKVSYNIALDARLLIFVQPINDDKARPFLRIGMISPRAFWDESCRSVDNEGLKLCEDWGIAVDGLGDVSGEYNEACHSFIRNFRTLMPSVYIYISSPPSIFRTTLKFPHEEGCMQWKLIVASHPSPARRQEGMQSPASLTDLQLKEGPILQIW